MLKSRDAHELITIEFIHTRRPPSVARINKAGKPWTGQKGLPGGARYAIRLWQSVSAPVARRAEAPAVNAMGERIATQPAAPCHEAPAAACNATRAPSRMPAGRMKGPAVTGPVR
jgi:hypothetical protein